MQTKWKYKLLIYKPVGDFELHESVVNDSRLNCGNRRFFATWTVVFDFFHRNTKSVVAQPPNKMKKTILKFIQLFL